MPKNTRVALVTGGARRVGRAIVQRLAEGGFDVAFTFNRSKREAASLAKWALRRTSRRAIAIAANLTEPVGAVQHIYSAFTAEFGRIDLLVNNASVYEPADLRSTCVDLMRRYSAIHVEAPLLLCQAFERLLKRSRGHVVNMSDLLAERPRPDYLAYCASKAALSNLTIGLARSLAPHVTVNAIAPGVVDWPEDCPLSERIAYLRRVPLGRSGRPRDVANLVYFLATGGSYISGQIIRLDGGRSVT